MTPVIGVLGAGQLGRMLALAGYPLGLRFRFYDSPDASSPSLPSPAGQVAELVTGDFNDQDALRRFGSGLHLVTYEFENVPVSAANALRSVVPVYPPPRALEVSQDRVAEKTYFRSLGIPTPEFAEIASRDALSSGLRSLGVPAVLKTRRFGYDGKGQALIRDHADADRAWADLGRAAQSAGGPGLILEQFVAFDREVSILGVRGRAPAGAAAQTAFYPLVENRHEGGILRQSCVPASAVHAADRNALQTQAQAWCARVMDDLGYVGVCCIELFQVRGADGAPTLLANEMACRVHNSGHWTIDGAHTSQFENHLRAALGMPLGLTAPRGAVAMLNLIGDAPALPSDVARAVLAVEDAHLHLYGKEARPGRKLGHVTIVAPDEGTLVHRLRRVREACGITQPP